MHKNCGFGLFLVVNRLTNQAVSDKWYGCGRILKLGLEIAIEIFTKHLKYQKTS